MKKKQTHTRLSLLMLVLGCLAVALPAAAWAQTAEESPSCEVTFSPPSVHGGSGEITVVAELSEPIGDVEAIETDEESGLQIGESEVREDGSVMIVLYTGQAVDGLWTIAFTGEAGACVGQLSVVADA